MGNEFELGKRTRVQTGASSVASTADIGSMAPTPGKRTLVEQTYGPTPHPMTGNAHIDYGPKCEANPTASECFLDDKQRERLVGWIMRRVDKAGENYKLALADLKTAELVKKPEDLHWVLGLALDLAGAHFLLVAGNALKGLRAAGLQKLSDASFSNTMRGLDDSKWAERAMSALNATTPLKIDSATRTAFGFAMPRIKESAKKQQNADAAEEKTVKTSYLDSLRKSCDTSFEQFLMNVTANANDAELILTYETFDPEFHSVDAYVDELGAKLKRYMKSGVPEIGEKRTQLPEGHLESTTRVILVQDIHGVQTPWYASKTDDYQGKGRVVHGELQLGKPVPEEFRSAAIAASEARFGAAPVIDDGYVALLKANGVNVSIVRGQLNGGAMVTKNQLYTGTSVFASGLPPWSEPQKPLPEGSIFDPNALSEDDKAMMRAMGLDPDKKP